MQALTGALWKGCGGARLFRLLLNPPRATAQRRHVALTH